MSILIIENIDVIGSYPDRIIDIIVFELVIHWFELEGKLFSFARVSSDITVLSGNASANMSNATSIMITHTIHSLNLSAANSFLKYLIYLLTRSLVSSISWHLPSSFIIFSFCFYKSNYA